MLRSLVGSEMCIRDSINAEYGGSNPAMSAASFKTILDRELKVYQDAQKEMGTLQTQRQQLTEQISENAMVQAELKLLEDDAEVFKLVGPVLVPQDQAEANANVEKRISYMKTEMEKCDKRMEEKNKEMEELQEKIAGLQQKLQEAMRK
eukprot:TRINITY_DN811_c0_g1_i10.p1 TRINITY_DN811_c0_g1~~TRINITY_DN811_c0_g1_i10.p1  ORF type:complete len:149 (-),score=73.18 TRINITY_DN811_c0_g1_i10:415-861(-)